jgi:hypothetical protein
MIISGAPSDFGVIFGSPSCSHRHREPDRDQVEHHRESEAMKPDAYGGRQGIAHAIEPVAITISAGSAASTDL